MKQQGNREAHGGLSRGASSGEEAGADAAELGAPGGGDFGVFGAKDERLVLRVALKGEHEAQHRAR